MLEIQSYPESISISAFPASNEGVRVYYDCVSTGKATKWSYIITIDGVEYSARAGVSDTSVNRAELETALQALSDLPDNANDVSVFTPRGYLYGALNGVNEEGPKQFKKLFAKLFLLIARTNAKVYCRAGNWGDKYAAKCHALAENAAANVEETAHED